MLLFRFFGGNWQDLLPNIWILFHLFRLTDSPKGNHEYIQTYGFCLGGNAIYSSSRFDRKVTNLNLSIKNCGLCLGTDALDNYVIHIYFTVVYGEFRLWDSTVDRRSSLISQLLT